MPQAPSPTNNDEVNGGIGLEHLFDLQNQAFVGNYQKSKLLQEALPVLDRSIRLNLAILGSMQFDAEKQTVIRYLAVDALSHIVIAARLGMWGALPESLSILRGGVESCAQLACIASQNEYKNALSEIGGKRLHRLKFEDVCKSLGKVGKAYQKYHSKVSNQAAHSTASRLRQAEYKHEGNSYDRLGFSLHVKSAEIAISECVEIIQNVGISLCGAYEQEGIPVQEAWITALNEIHTAHRNLQDQIRTQ